MVARKCCKDKIAPVFFSGLDLLKAVIEQFAEAVEYTAVCSHLSDLLGPILKKMSNKNARMQREAAKYVTCSLVGRVSLSPAVLPIHFETICSDKPKDLCSFEREFVLCHG